MYTINEIKTIISPIAAKHGVNKVYLFGSYAKKQANANSDIDIRIDRGDIRTLFQLSGFRLEIEDALSVPVDVITSDGTERDFLQAIQNDEVLIYG